MSVTNKDIFKVNWQIHANSVLHRSEIRGENLSKVSQSSIVSFEIKKSIGFHVT